MIVPCTKRHPSVSFATTMKIFVLASLGITIHFNVDYVGLNYTSATIANALSNVIPGLRFLLTVLFRQPSSWTLEWDLNLLTIMYSVSSLNSFYTRVRRSVLPPNMGYH
ncbi:hypothetical protein IFM89_025379 [Coptis chinensis]|uniref:WAT1-related protein n=1 Tax=Coptis chinensis TaxID=261450 RepID=A0A835ISU3_9MAGN|nr:hypothetical protein IFM89_025379 [Coptis chinensis]